MTVVKKMMRAFLEFSEICEKVEIELDGLHSPRTVKAIVESLPLTMVIERWGDELYSEETQVKVGEENAKAQVDLFDVAYWPKDSALCFFYGPTPISSKTGKVLPYSPVNIVGTIKSRPADIGDFLQRVEETHVAKRMPVILRRGQQTSIP
ncbi:MAG TPA: cyclophilin-like family protein [Nitrososphaera sp.]|nr:cyclophilin-like family protein [Nitrososphaera sp.]